MKFVSPLLIALLSAVFFCHHATAQGQPPRVDKYPDAKPGERFTYVDGVFLLKCNRWEVKEVNQSGQVVSKCGGNTVYSTADSGNPIMSVNDKGETVAKFTPHYPTLSFPLFVGKQWSGKYKGEQGKISWTGDLRCEATAFEQIQIAAGKFDAFRIECANKWDSGIIFINGTKKSTSWYAPAVNLIVKSTNDDSQWSYEVAGGDWR